MKDILNRFIRQNYSLSVTVGFIAAIGGIVLSYVTNDTEPWGTIGGMVFALFYLCIPFFVLEILFFSILFLGIN